MKGTHILKGKGTSHSLEARINNEMESLRKRFNKGTLARVEREEMSKEGNKETVYLSDIEKALLEYPIEKLRAQEAQQAALALDEDELAGINWIFEEEKFHKEQVILRNKIMELDEEEEALEEEKPEVIIEKKPEEEQRLNWLEEEPGEADLPWGNQVMADKEKARLLFSKLTLASFNQGIQSRDILEKLLGSIEEHAYIESGFKCTFGYNIHVGNHFYAGHDCIILDQAKVTIGENCILSPKVSIYTCSYPVDELRRAEGYEYSRPVQIGDNVWVGANTVIYLGVTIGNNVIIAPGTVVFDDIPDNVIVGGNPGRIIKQIS